jgi:2-haloalkanoic acid dehalogenase type II
MSIKAIFLDFHGTVVHEDEASLIEICHKIKGESNTEATIEEIGYFWMKEFNQLLNSSFGEKFLKQRELSATSLRNTLNKFNSEANEDELLELMFYPWKNPNIYQDAVEFIESNHLPLFILSNADHLDISEAMNHLHLNVDGVITSEHVKAYKPHPNLYKYALDVCGFSPEEVLHVGDSLTSDILGANQVGINSVWLNRRNKPVTGNDKPDYIIQNLNEILHLPVLVKN